MDGFVEQNGAFRGAEHRRLRVMPERGRKCARVLMHTDVRVRAGPAAPRSTGHSDSHDANQNTASGA